MPTNAHCKCTKCLKVFHDPVTRTESYTVCEEVCDGGGSTDARYYRTETRTEYREVTVCSRCGAFYEPADVKPPLTEKPSG
jgi:hypothetical protein